MISLKGVTDEKQADSVVASVVKNSFSSGSRYWAVLKNDRILFFKNENSSKLYNAMSVDKVSTADDIITYSSFNYNNNEYKLSLISKRSYVLSSADIGKFRIYFYLYIMCISVILLTIVYSLHRYAMSINEKLIVAESEMKNKNKTIQGLSEVAITNSSRESINVEYLSKCDSYKYKFYINASHSIYIDGNLGESHPHTWEISVEVVKMNNSFVEFDKFENVVEEYLSKFQDSYINDIEPFDKINPTLENICAFFKDEFIALTEKSGLSLIEIGISETPSRSYIITNK